MDHLQIILKYKYEIAIRSTFMQTVNDNLWLFHVTRKNKYYHMKYP